MTPQHTKRPMTKVVRGVITRYISLQHTSNPLQVVGGIEGPKVPIFIKKSKMKVKSILDVFATKTPIQSGVPQ